MYVCVCEQRMVIHPIIPHDLRSSQTITSIKLTEKDLHSKEHHLIAPVMKLWKLLLTLSLLFSLLRFAFPLNATAQLPARANNGAKQLRFHRAGLFMELYFFPIPGHFR